MQFLASRISLVLVTIATIFGLVNSVFATETDIIKNVIKIKTYELQSNGSYVFKGFGSAIAISPSRVLTNAHVILNSEGIPTGLYEACFSSDFEKAPICRERANLIAYDIVADLAILELPYTNSLVPFSFSASKVALGSYVSMYGYPLIGGETITRTEGKIAGYEQMMYKIDGSIDHGNSGGGAFNNSGELVGIPTAVASDNASIGYMIPIKRIQLFLDKKTNNYESYVHKVDRSFAKFLQRNQSYNGNRNILRWNNVTLKNPRLYGFTLKSSMISSDNKMTNWMYADSYDRVKITLSCTDDAGGSLGWQVRKDGFLKEQESYPSWQMRMVEDTSHLMVYSSSKGYDPSVVLYYKGYDACFAEVSYVDEKMDAKGVQKAINFLKKGISFEKSYELKNSQENQFFKIENLQKDTRVIRSIDQIGNESILLGFEIEKNRWINAVIEGKQYDTLQDIGSAFDIDFDEIKTWKQYMTLGIKNGIKSDDIHLIKLASGQQGVLYTRYDDEKDSTSFTFEYTHVLSSGKHAYWMWTATTSGNLTKEVSRLKEIFSSLVVPGQSILRN